MNWLHKFLVSGNITDSEVYIVYISIAFQTFFPLTFLQYSFSFF